MSCLVSRPRGLSALLLFLVAAALLLSHGEAQTVTGKKYALLVGVRTYRHSDLENLKYTENDVEELAKALKGFTEIVVLTSTRGETQRAAAPTAANIRKQLRHLLENVGKDDTIVVALAGHGLQLKVKGKDTEEGFFCPADAKPREEATLDELSKSMLGFTELFKDLQDSGIGVKLLLVDACRNNPKEGRSINPDALPRAPRGFAALFSCKSGERAFETDKLGKGHGVFFHHVIQGLKGQAKNARGEVTWARLTEYVTDAVSDEVPTLIGKGAKQTPEQKLSLTGKSPVLVALVKEGAKEISNSIGMKLVRIPAGTFQMGSTKAEQDAVIAYCEKWYKAKVPDTTIAYYRAEGPRHEVEITKPFYLGICEVTQKQYEKVMGKNPSWFSADGGGKDKVKGKVTDDFPVEQVSWEDAVEFCRKLSDLPAEKGAGRKYRLPTEAEWEYSCRGGAASSKPFHFGNSLSSKQANFNNNYRFGGADKGEYLQRTCKVSSYAKNGFGLYDMHGNVAEWCSDWYGEDYYAKSDREDPKGPASGVHRVLRGGSWRFDDQDCRSAVRNMRAPDYRFRYMGFRAALVPSGSR